MKGLAYCQSLLGCPWVSGGRGPTEFDCWGLVFNIYHEVLAIDLPAYPNVDARNTLLVTRLLWAGSNAWRQLTAPEHLCAVGLSSGRFITHVGIWLDCDGGGVLHAASGRGVTFQSRASLAFNGLNNLTFFSYDPSSPLHQSLQA